MSSPRARPRPTTVVSSKGQVVIPSWARRELGIVAGDTLSVEIAAGAGERAVILRASTVADLEELLQKGYRWLDESGRDPVAALHEARRQARAHERHRRRTGRGRRTHAA